MFKLMIFFLTLFFGFFFFKPSFFSLIEYEAMWIHFSSKYQNPRRTYLVKIFAGNVNVISGRTRGGRDDDSASPFTDTNTDTSTDTNTDTDTNTEPDDGSSHRHQLQDYVVIPGQNWVDGMAVAPSVVRQFLACPLGSGQTVESLVTGEENEGGIRFEVLAVDEEDYGGHGDSEEGEGEGTCDLEKKIQGGSPATMTVSIKALTGRTWRYKVKPGWSIEKLKHLFLLKSWEEPTGKTNSALESELEKCSKEGQMNVGKTVFIFAGKKLEVWGSTKLIPCVC